MSDSGSVGGAIELDFQEGSRKAPLGMSRIYADASSRKTRSWFDSENLRIRWSDGERYHIIDKLGRGHFGEVFEAIDSELQRPCVVKVLKPVKEDIIKREVKFLVNLAGGPNIISLYDAIQDPVTAQKSLVFEHVNNPDFKVFYANLTDGEVRFYMYQLLLALDFTHSQGIIHRDIKPHNVLIDPDRKILRLIDWGLAEYYHPKKPFHKFPGTRVYKAPELLLEYPLYDYNADMWSVGCMLASIVFQKQPLFRGRKENLNVMVEIIKILGTRVMDLFLEKYNVQLKPGWRRRLKKRSARPWQMFVDKDNQHLCPPEAINLVGRLLTFDHEERINILEALAHPYFAEVRASTEPDRTAYNGEALHVPEISNMPASRSSCCCK